MNSDLSINTSFHACRSSRRHLHVPGIFVLSLVGLAPLTLVHGQSGIQRNALLPSGPLVAACKEPESPPAIKDALHLVCAKHSSSAEPVRPPIIVCFLGGFVKPSDGKHPEVWFARYLRDRYGPGVQVWIFGNREEEKAIKKTVQFTTAGRTRALKTAQQPAIIAFGHSWGGSEVLAFARDLGKRHIAVSVTIQIDSVRKMGQDGRTVPQNVIRAINFYQTGGLTPGERHIVAADPSRTVILGNLKMTYDHLRIDCSNYKWLSRVFNKPHHKIENDPRVWNRIASLIHAELTAR